MAQRNGTGMFPREVMERFPLLPLEEEGRLNDMPLRKNFIERVLPVGRARQGLRRKAKLSTWQFVAARCEKLHNRMDRDAGQRTHPGGLVKFHTAHKLTRETCSVSRAMAHSPS